ncbi:hypothetical protein ACQ4PT_071141 [Festuca glaucescens]
MFRAEAPCVAAVTGSRPWARVRSMRACGGLGSSADHGELELTGFCMDAQAQEEITRKIQQKKEELYDVISMAQQSFWTSSSSNKRLLEHLAVQVNPRPEDPKWRRLCFSRRAKAVLDTVGYVAATGVVASVAVNVVVYFIKSYPKDRDAARAMIREEMREAREAKTRSGLKEH